jgi:Fic family protein
MAKRKRPRRPSRPCNCCGGTGRLEVTGAYAETLALLRRELRPRDEITGAALAAVAGCKPTAMNNRLARLEELGFVTSRRFGRLRLFRLSPDA